MSKKKIILIIICIGILFILNIFVMMKSIYVPDDYYKDVTEEQKELVVDILKNVSFSDELKENVSAKDIYKEFTSINNYQYKTNVYKFMEIANDKLKEDGSSFVQSYKDGHTFDETLYQFAGEDYSKFIYGYLLGDDKNEEYPESSVNNTYNSLLTKISKNNFSNVISTIDSILDKYKLTESYNLKITNIYHDAQILNDNTNLSDTEVLETLYDPCVYTIQVMKLFQDDRINVISDKNVPAFYSSTIINVKNIETIELSSKSEEYKDLYKKIYDLYVGADMSDTIQVSKISFIVDNETFYAYVATLEDKTCKLYTIEPKEEKTYESLTDVVRESETTNTELNREAKGAKADNQSEGE